MVATYLIDTNIVAAVVNDPRCSAAQAWQRFAAQTVSTAIVRAEVAYGVARRPTRKAIAAAALLDATDCLPFTTAHADEAGQVRAELEVIGRPAGALDHLIAGVARSENLILVTRNVKHFKDVQQLTVTTW